MESFVQCKMAHLWWMLSCMHSLSLLVKKKKQYLSPRSVASDLQIILCVSGCACDKPELCSEQRNVVNKLKLKVCLFCLLWLFLFKSCVFSRCVTCHSAWRRCSAGTSLHTTRTGPWQSASCAIRSSPGTTTSKYIWRMSTGRRRARAN